MYVIQIETNYYFRPIFLRIKSNIQRINIQYYSSTFINTIPNSQLSQSIAII